MCMYVCMYVISGPHGRPDIMFYLHNYILSELATLIKYIFKYIFK